MTGEGCFRITTKQPPHVDGDPRLRFVFEVKVASRDRALLEALRQALSCGSIREVPPREAHWQPLAIYSVSSRRSHRHHVIPFMDHHLLPSAKRTQFDLWCAALTAYEAEHPSRWGEGLSPCRVAGCDEPVRGRGLCRRHYYRETGH